MGYKETYRDLYHGTDTESAKKIEETGFEIRGNNESWCGKGVYFYDIKKKAWWAAERKCREIQKETKEKLKPAILLADIVDIDAYKIFDMRVYKDMQDFKERTESLFGNFKFDILGLEDETERCIMLRSMMISFYADTAEKELIIGNFKQRPQPKYDHIIEFSDNLNIVFGIETIYCVKNKGIIKNVRRRCRNGKHNN